jgi:hypothetical protein
MELGGLVLDLAAWAASSDHGILETISSQSLVFECR